MGARPKYGLGTSAAGKAVPPARPRTLGPLLAAVLQIGVGPRRRFSQTKPSPRAYPHGRPTVSASAEVAQQLLAEWTDIRAIGKLPNRPAPRPGARQGTLVAALLL